MNNPPDIPKEGIAVAGGIGGAALAGIVGGIGALIAVSASQFSLVKDYANCSIVGRNNYDLS